MKPLVSILATICFCITAQTKADVLTVPTPYTTIQAAIDDANNGDVVQVAPGTYTENINFLGKAITVTSTDPEDPGIVASTIIDANGLGSVVTFDSNETNNAVLTGFTITGGTGTYVLTAADTNMYWGAGICCDDSSPTISRNVITENHGPAVMDGNTPIAVTYGGGIVSMGGAPVIARNTIRNNTAYCGAAIAVISGDAVISNNLIYANSAIYGGGAVQMFGGQLLSNTIVTNSGDFGGGSCMLYDELIGSGFAKDNIISDNAEGGGLYADFNSLYTTTYEFYGTHGEYNINYSLDFFLSNNLFNNSPNDYFDTNDLVGIAGNISIDPCFVNPGYWHDNGTPTDANDDFWVDGDYHLKSAGWRWDGIRQRWDWDNVTSRCIDIGNPGTPLGDEPLTIPDDPNNIWGKNLRYNIGAFGRTEQASMPPHGWALLSDINNDGTVDLTDFAEFADLYIQSGNEQPADFSRDGTVNTHDLELLAGDWVNTTPWH